MKQVNWGIIGLGAIASQFSKGFKFTANAKLLGIASNDLNKIKRFKDDFDISNDYCFSSYENLIKNKNIDIIYIALPTSMHFEWVVKCLNEGKRVLVEKPATTNSTEAESIKKNFLNKSIFFTEALMYLYHPQIKKVIELIKLKEIGDLISMDTVFGSDILTKKNFFGFKKKKKINPENRLFNKKMGGGAILDLGCYPISFSTLIASMKSQTDLDKVEICNKKKEIVPSGVDLDSYIELKFQNNFKSKVGVSFTKNLGKQTTIFGTKGEIIIEDTWTANNSKIKIKKKNEDRIIEFYSNENIYSYEIENLSQNILDNKANVEYPGLTIDDIIVNMKIIDKWLK